MSSAEDRSAHAPVFLVDGVDWHIRIGDRLPVHVLPLPAPTAITSIEELAERYLAVLFTTQPFGPYRLLGKALGGLVAYELASQLLGRDERVEFLGLVDCPKPRDLYPLQPLPIPLHYFTSDLRPEVETTRAWRALAGDSLRVITSNGVLHEDVIADAIMKAPRQQFLQRAAESEAYLPLVTLQIGSSREAPMFFVPGAGASVTSCLDLAQSLPQQITLHGLQSRGLDGTSVPHRTIEAAAAVYLRAIRQAQARGPYRLAGHSFGGWIIFELACRLAAEGETVEPIVLIDTDAPTMTNEARCYYGRTEALTKLVRLMEEWSGRSMNLMPDDLAILDYESQLSRLSQGMKAIGALARHSDANDIRGLVRVFEVNLNTSYVPAARFPGLALLLQPATRSKLFEDERPAHETSEAWRAHVGALECASVPGKHMTMLRRPQVDVIAERLSKLWSNPPRRHP